MILIPTGVTQSTFKDSPTEICFFFTQSSWLKTIEVASIQSNENNNHWEIGVSILGLCCPVGLNLSQKSPFKKSENDFEQPEIIIPELIT